MLATGDVAGRFRLSGSSLGAASPCRKHGKRCGSFGPCGAFTLVELLVVIAIIGILASLIISPVARAPRRARQVACLNHLRQIGLAFQMDLQESNDRFPDRRDLKSSLGYRGWTDWPPSDPRGGWVPLVLTIGDPRVWMCPGVARSALTNAPQVIQRSGAGASSVAVSYWLWRFDRDTTPVPADNFWGKTPEQALADLRGSGNATVGQPQSFSEVELVVDPYFPNTLPTVSPVLAGRSAHGGGRNRLMLESSAALYRDSRTPLSP